MRFAILTVCVLAGCGADDPAAAVVHNYAVNLEQNYKDVLPTLDALAVAVDGFVANPTADGLTAARAAWLASRGPWGECEHSRFYGGPIDKSQGGMNEWPIDESFIDYTTANSLGGIINDPQHYPQLTAQVIATADQKGGTENLSTGFHAIEFLLWGQRPSQTAGPGERPHTDYVDGGTAANQARRRTYLQVATQLLGDDMRALAAQWDASDATSYGAMFLAAPPKTSLTKLYRGFSQMAISEVFYERFSDAYISKDAKDEQSCFSESTLADLQANALGLEDVYLGRYRDRQGPSISDLVKAKDAALDGQIRQQLAAIRAALAAIPPPFDHAVLAPAGSPQNLAVVAAVDAFTPLQELLGRGATTLGIVSNL